FVLSQDQTLHKRNLISSNCFAGIMFDVQNFVSFTNSRLVTKNFIDYVLLVQFSRFKVQGSRFKVHFDAVVSVATLI
ncbi:hypothetical protein, partial [Lysinibacillus xylanilyticus]|uniref:hypothetical protein n=1 Tax=Lysinibacillus xylanilyticus TaxID=582475 RepID=UPI003D063157